MALGTRDGKAGGAPWRVGIQHPRPQGVGGAPLATLELQGRRSHRHLGRLPPLFRGGGAPLLPPARSAQGFPATGTQAVTVLIPPGPAGGNAFRCLVQALFIAGGDWRAMAGKLRRRRGAESRRWRHGAARPRRCRRASKIEVAGPQAGALCDEQGSENRTQCATHRRHCGICAASGASSMPTTHSKPKSRAGSGGSRWYFLLLPRLFWPGSRSDRMKP